MTLKIPRRVLVVRRSDLERLRRIKERFDGLPIDTVIDRRYFTRRGQQTGWAVERRHLDRRVTWPSQFPSSAFVTVPVSMAEQWVAPARGDALVCKLEQTHASGGYGLSLIPGEVQSRYDVYELAVERAKRFARYAAADLWYTEDALTFVLLEMFRRPASARAGRRR